MLSHTVPQRLLRQFAYEHVATKSLRLWKYEKGRPPFGKASPRTATTYEKFFADPENTEEELRIETTLAREVENPVNAFLDQLSGPSSTLSENQQRHMTRYVTLLFSRSAARREGSKHTQEILARAFSNFIADQVRVMTVAAHWSMERYFAGRPRLITASEVIKAAKRFVAYTQTDEAAQKSFVAHVRNSCNYFDNYLFEGQWNLISTTQYKPFIISDAPVTTWIRDEHGVVQYGAGIARPDVEVLLPLSPMTCLHILPKVQRTRATVTPHVDEVNRVQAAFAYRACYTNQKSCAIDELVQKHISTARIGKEVFTVWHMQYDDFFYQILMDQGRAALDLISKSHP